MLKIIVLIFVCVPFPIIGHDSEAKSRQKREDVKEFDLTLPEAEFRPISPEKIELDEISSNTVYPNGTSCSCKIGRFTWNLNGIIKYTMVKDTDKGVTTASQQVSYATDTAEYTCSYREQEKSERVTYTGLVYPTPTINAMAIFVTIVFQCVSSNWVKMPQVTTPFISYTTNEGELPMAVHEMIIMLFSKTLAEAQYKIEKGFNIGVWVKHGHFDGSGQGPYRCVDEPEAEERSSKG